MSVAFISHPECSLHDMGYEHPESPERLAAIMQRLLDSDSSRYLQHYDAPIVTKEALYLAHDPRYVDSIFDAAPTGHRTVHFDADTTMNAHTLSAAQRAAGALVFAVDRVMEGRHQAAFCCVRPPGHHAEYRHAMGFCFFNNIAVGVKHAITHWQLNRIAIIDFDVHHGNGTEDIFHDDPRVMLFSTFQSPLYPFKGESTISNRIINLPMPAGCDGRMYHQLVKTQLLPKLESFQPELVFFSAGFDAHCDDPLANINLTADDFAWITRKVKQVADNYARGRIVSSLEGGYSLNALACSVEAHLRALCGSKISTDYGV